MLDAFDRAKKNDSIRKTHTDRGHVAQTEFIKWLENFLPKKYGVTSGYIISQNLSEDVPAPQYDIIIYDQLEAPILWVENDSGKSNVGQSRAIPAEYVRGVIEVKSSFSNQSVKQAMEHLEELSPLLAQVVSVHNTVVT